MFQGHLAPLPAIVAHRGASRDRPENTRAAFDAALDQEADGLELDLQLSADGVPVVYHDRTLRRAGLPRRRVSSLAAADLARLDVGGAFSPAHAGERIPTLDEVLARYGRRTTLFLELKAREYDRRKGTHRRLTERTVEALRARRMTGGVFLLSYDLECLELARTLARDVRPVLDFRRAPRFTATFRAAVEPLAALAIHERALNAACVARARELGKAIMTFPCNRPAALKRALAAGVQVIMTGRPAWVATELGRRMGRP